MQKFTILDYAYIAVLVLVTFIVLRSNILRSQVILACGAIAWSLAHIIRLKRLMKTALPTDAVVVNYSVKTKKLRQEGMFHTNTYEYQVYAPVLRYETETQVIESSYSVYEELRWFKDGEQFLIHYIPSKPELFYFPGKERELTSAYAVVLILAGILLLVTVGLGFPVLIG